MDIEATVRLKPVQKPHILKKVTAMDCNATSAQKLVQKPRATKTNTSVNVEIGSR